jgi:hypothetical protein
MCQVAPRRDAFRPSPARGRTLVRTTILLGLSVLAAGSIYLARLRMRSDRRSFEKDGLTQFKASFPGRDLPDALLEQTYAHLIERREAVGEDDASHFNVAPGHDLRTVYHLDGLDIEDAVLVIADRATARLPRAHDLDDLKGHVKTVQDMVDFLEPYFAPEPEEA